MARTTDVPEKIKAFVERHPGKSFTSEQISKQVKASIRVTRMHLLALYEAKLILRDYRYDGAIGAYHYYARPGAV